MLSRLFGWLEARISVFAPFDDKLTPPTNVWGFIWHYVRPFRSLLAVTMVLVFIVGIVEASMLLLLGKFIDLLANSSPQTFLQEHGFMLSLLTAFILLFRPLIIIASDILVNQSLVQPVVSRVRWRTHLYTLGHALSYFQNDYAGRLANRIIQGGPGVQNVVITLIDTMTYVVIYSTVMLVAFGNVSWMLAVPVFVWMAAYVALLYLFVPRAVTLSHIQSSARSVLMGRIVDSYTNIQTVKLFARTEQERSSVREAIADHTRKGLEVFRLLSLTLTALMVMNSILLFATGVIAISLWQKGLITVGAIAAGLALVLRISDMSRWVMQMVRGIFENLGTVQESIETISRPHALSDEMGATPLVVAKGEIEFEHVTFHYGKKSGVIRRSVVQDRARRESRLGRSFRRR